MSSPNKAGAVLLLVFLALSLLLPGCTQQNPESVKTNNTQAPGSVEIKNFAFDPAQITIKAGEQVTWTNGDAMGHDIVSDSGEAFKSEILATGQSFSHTFSTPGTYQYHCGVHPSMNGKVIVE
jgi:amicyanin